MHPLASLKDDISHVAANYRECVAFDHLRTGRPFLEATDAELEKTFHAIGQQSPDEHLMVPLRQDAAQFLATQLDNDMNDPIIASLIENATGMLCSATVDLLVELAVDFYAVLMPQGDDDDRNYCTPTLTPESYEQFYSVIADFDPYECPFATAHIYEEIKSRRRSASYSEAVRHSSEYAICVGDNHDYTAAIGRHSSRDYGEADYTLATGSNGQPLYDTAMQPNQTYDNSAFGDDPEYDVAANLAVTGQQQLYDVAQPNGTDQQAVYDTANGNNQNGEALYDTATTFGIANSAQTTDDVANGNQTQQGLYDVAQVGDTEPATYDVAQMGDQAIYDTATTGGADQAIYDTATTGGADQAIYDTATVAPQQGMYDNATSNGGYGQPVYDVVASQDNAASHHNTVYDNLQGVDQHTSGPSPMNTVQRGASTTRPEYSTATGQQSHDYQLAANTTKPTPEYEVAANSGTNPDYDFAQ
jgi:hypothetical protein